MDQESAPLPDELITEILVRLPVKSLLRFKIVSKSWYALIRSPNFVNQHTKRDRRETILFSTVMSLNPHAEEKYDSFLSLHDPDCSDLRRLSPKFPVPLADSNDEYRDIICPCNGLFVISYWNTLMLCNPALREFKVLPPRPSYLRRNEVYDNRGYGFGFDPLTGSYKVIGIYDFAGSPPVVELYDSRSNSWKTIDSTHEMLPYIYKSFETFFKGACHWEAHDLRSSRPPVVLCFDVSTEVFRHFEFPKWDGGYEDEYRMSVLRDRLTLFFLPWQKQLPSSTSIDIWVMEEYGVKESWAQAFKIEVNSRIRAVSFFWKDERILVQDDNGGPKCLDLRNSELGQAFTLHKRCYWWNAIIFKESLISLDDVICNAQDG